MDETTPTVPTYDHIDWKQFITSNEAEAVELVNEWINDNVSVIRRVPVTFSGYLDCMADTIEEMEDCDITVEDEQDRDDHDFDDEEFSCNHCSSSFSYSSYFIEHAIEVNADEIAELSIDIITFKNFFLLLQEYIWSEEKLVSALIGWLLRDKAKTEEFVNYTQRHDLIPPVVWDKFEEYPHE